MGEEKGKKPVDKEIDRIRNLNQISAVFASKTRGDTRLNAVKSVSMVDFVTSHPGYIRCDQKSGVEIISVPDEDAKRVPVIDLLVEKHTGIENGSQVLIHQIYKSGVLTEVNVLRDGERAFQQIFKDGALATETHFHENGSVAIVYRDGSCRITEKDLDGFVARKTEFNAKGDLARSLVPSPSRFRTSIPAAPSQPMQSPEPCSGVYTKEDFGLNEDVKDQRGVG